MNDFAIVCFSCDKNEEVWPTFMTCLSKYWETHPKVYLFTETLTSNLMETINYNYNLCHWTTRIYKSLEAIPEKKILFICDDVFLDNYVNLYKLQTCIDILNENKNVAYVNLETFVDEEDYECEYPGFVKKAPYVPYRLCFLCGVWNKEKLMDLLGDYDCSPWQIEGEQKTKDYDVYQVRGDKVLSWFRDGFCQCGAKYTGKWAPELPEFLKKENIVMDLEKKGFNYE